MVASKFIIFIKAYVEYQIKVYYNFNFIQTGKQMLVFMDSHCDVKSRIVLNYHLSIFTKLPFLIH